VPSGHIIQSAQIVLWIKQGNNTRKILYTSDLGNISVEKHYIRKFEPITNANLVIAESTYSRNDRSITQKDKLKDLEKIKTVVNQYCIERHGRVLIPIFSLDRTQNVLTLLYEIFGKDKNYKGFNNKKRCY
jgi:metallo-beta-lactamase family protein